MNDISLDLGSNVFHFNNFDFGLISTRTLSNLCWVNVGYICMTNVIPCFNLCKQSLCPQLPINVTATVIYNLGRLRVIFLLVRWNIYPPPSTHTHTHTHAQCQPLFINSAWNFFFLLLSWLRQHSVGGGHFDKYRFR